MIINDYPYYIMSLNILHLLHYKPNFLQITRCNSVVFTNCSIATSVVLSLECSIDCISGSVGHQQNIFGSFAHCQRFF